MPISPENISQREFYTDVQGQLPIKHGEVLRHLPSATRSFLREAGSYRTIFNRASEMEKGHLRTGPAMLLSLWAYSEISGRSIRQLHEEGVLLPAVSLYGAIVIQDDILDNQRHKDPTFKAKQAFWYTEDETISSPSPRERYHFSVQQINDNTYLQEPVKRYMTRKLAHAYQNYVVGEDSLGQMARDNEHDLFRTHDVLANSFGTMTKALSAVLNGNTAQTEQGYAIEDRMAWFELAGEIIDGELDKKEDAPYTVTLPIVADIFDAQWSRKEGETTEKLLQFYLSQLSSSKVATIMITARYLYPRIEKLLQGLNGFMSFSQTSLKHD